MNKKIVAIITVDTDWASDEILRYMADIFLKNNIKSTWFITNGSPFVNELKKMPELFELGIHPNFMSNSTQGSTCQEVMSFLTNILPKAKIMRTHSLYQSTNIFKNITENNPLIKADVSLYIPEPVKPFRIVYSDRYPKRSIIRLPFCWEDDLCIMKGNRYYPSIRDYKEGVCIINFHPIHILINSRTLDNYKEFKKRYKTPNVSLADALKFKNDNGFGVRDYLLSIINNKLLQFKHVKEIIDL